MLLFAFAVPMRRYRIALRSGCMMRLNRLPPFHLRRCVIPSAVTPTPSATQGSTLRLLMLFQIACIQFIRLTAS